MDSNSCSCKDSNYHNLKKDWALILKPLNIKDVEFANHVRNIREYIWTIGWRWLKLRTEPAQTAEAKNKL